MTKEMSTLAALCAEALDGRKGKFLALFPGGPQNGSFLDPALKLMLIDGMDGFVPLAGFESVPALWIN